MIDRHRRWTLTARPKDGLLAQSDAWGKREIDTTGLNVGELVQALDGGTVAKDAQAALVRLFAPNQKSAYSDYQVTVTPLTAGRSWRVVCHIVAELVVDAERSEL